VAEPVHQDEMPPLAAALTVVHFLCPILFVWLCAVLMSIAIFIHSTSHTSFNRTDDHHYQLMLQET
jgi:hypothetical protein